jgi:MscS family membrane protein|tara:strand:+ start:11025 stop:12104 length:1080 start_codon:yes stop_codon:yes gene_type:complete
LENQIETLADISLPWIEWIGPYIWLQAAIIIALGLVLAFIAERLIVATLEKIVARTSSAVDDEVIAALKRPLFLSIFFISLALATYRLNLPTPLTNITLASLTTITVIAWLGFFIRLTHVILGAFSKAQGRYEFVQPSTLPLFDNSAKLLLFLSALYFIFLAWGINVSALIASAGIVGLALSFGAQDALSNIFGGMSILADRPFKVGDFINLDTGERGEVTHIGLRSTRLLTRDDVEISVPNSVMGNAKVINETGGPHEKFRIRVGVGVAYGSDIDQVEQALINVASSHPEICTTPKPLTRFRAFGNSSLDFELLAWVNEPILRGRLEHELHCGVYKAFNEAGIVIPFPQQDIHIKNQD